MIVDPCQYPGCPDPHEPFHIHNGGVSKDATENIIPNYFSIGRCRSGDDAARAWKQRALAAESPNTTRNLPA